jgi:hypothetical protein
MALPYVTGPQSLILRSVRANEKSAHFTSWQDEFRLLFHPQ